MEPAGQTEEKRADWRPYVAVGLLGAVVAGLTALNWYGEYVREQQQEQERQPSPYGRYRR